MITLMETAKVAWTVTIVILIIYFPGDGERVTPNKMHGSHHTRHLPDQWYSWPWTLSNKFQVRGWWSFPAEGEKILLPRCTRSRIQGWLTFLRLSRPDLSCVGVSKKIITRESLVPLDCPEESPWCTNLLNIPLSTIWWRIMSKLTPTAVTISWRLTLLALS